MHHGIKLTRYLPALALAALVFSGCNMPLADLPGHYEGSVFQRIGGKATQLAVRSEVSFDKSGRGKVEVRDVKDRGFMTIELSDVKENSFRLLVPGFMDAPVTLTHKDGCYLRSGSQSFRFCLAKGELTLEMTAEGQGAVFTLALDRFKKLDAYPMEKPADYTLSAAVDYALKKNFDNRAEFESVKQARYTKNLARLNLLPGVSLPSITAMYVMDMASLIGSIGDLAPFLLPTRWLQAAEAGKRLEAENDALILLRADTATAVEGVGYIVARDLAMQKFYRETLKKAKEVLSQIQAREHLGLLPPGAADDAKTVVNGIEQALMGLELSVEEDFTGLAQTMGFHNPEAVRSLALDEEIEPIAAAKTYDRDELVKMALDRSFELRQIDSLIKVARYQKTEKYFNWLDPAGDPNGKLGFGIGEYVKIAGSNVNQMLIKREQLSATISNKVVNNLKEYKSALKTWGLVRENMAIQSRRLTRIIGAAHFGATGDLNGMVQVFQDYLAGEVAKEAVIASYRVARAKMDRFLLEGYYRGLAQRPDPAPARKQP